MTNAADRASFGVLTQTFVPDLVQAVTTQGGALQQRRRELPAPLTLYLVLALWLWRNLSYKEVWRRLADGCAFTGPAPGLPVPASGAPEASSISRARERLGTHPLALLFDQTRGPLADAATPGAFWRGYHLSAVDGTCLDVCDTSANREAFGGPTGGAFPPDPPSGPRRDQHKRTDRRLLRRLCHQRKDPVRAPGRLLHARHAHHLRRGLLRLGPVHHDHCYRRPGHHARRGPVRPGPLQVLDDGSYTAYLSKGGPLVRVIEYTVHADTETDQGTTSAVGEIITLVTSLLDPQAHPISDFPGLYAARWEAEMLFDAVKTELRGGTTVRFRSQSPDLVRQEAWALLLVYQAVSDLITRAAGHQELGPGRVSFTTALNTARRSVQATGGRFPPEYLAALDQWAIGELMDDLLPARRSRCAPRQVCRRSFRFPTRKRETPASGRTRYRIHLWHLPPPAKTP